MDKKTALVLLLENSLMIPDRMKQKILKELANLSQAHIDSLGSLLAQEHSYIVKNKPEILKNVKLLLDSISLATA